MISFHFKWNGEDLVPHPKDNPVGFIFRLTNPKTQLTLMVTAYYNMQMKAMS